MNWSLTVGGCWSGLERHQGLKEAASMLLQLRTVTQ